MDVCTRMCVVPAFRSIGIAWATRVFSSFSRFIIIILISDLVPLCGHDWSAIVEAGPTDTGTDMKTDMCTEEAYVDMQNGGIACVWTCTRDAINIVS